MMTDAKVVAVVAGQNTNSPVQQVDECIMVETRRMSPKGDVYTDEAVGQSIISSKLAETVAKRALVVKTAFYRDGTDFETTGAGAFIDHAVATALHTLTIQKSATLWMRTIYCPEMHIAKSILCHNVRCEEDLKPVDVGGEETWKYSIDIFWGKTDIYRGSSRECEYGSFVSVDNNFKIKAGTKIAFAALNNIIINDADSIIERRNQLSDLFGPQNKVNVYTGEVTEVFDSYFTHNINTKQGFSGGVIVLTDGSDQLDIVEETNYGKAIGIHAGCNTATGSNFAFKLSASKKKGVFRGLVPQFKSIAKQVVSDFAGSCSTKKRV